MRPRTVGLVTVAVATLQAIGAAGASEPVPAPSMASRFDVAFGIGATSDYLARGISQTDNNPAVQGFFEFDYDRFYAGAWGSNVTLARANDLEMDLAVGWRPSAGDFDFDFGYVQYVYLDDPTGRGFGELYAGVSRSVLPNLNIGAKVNFAPDYANSGTEATYIEGTADLKLPHNFGISGGVGYQIFDPAFASNYFNGNVGIYWNLNKQVKVDLRASTTDLSRADCARIMSVGDECGTKVLLSVSFSDLISNLTKKN